MCRLLRTNKREHNPPVHSFGNYGFYIQTLFCKHDLYKSLMKMYNNFHEIVHQWNFENKKTCYVYNCTKINLTPSTSLADTNDHIPLNKLYDIDCISPD